VTDSEELNKKNQYFRDSLRKNMLNATGPKRTEADIIRTAIWYEFVRQKLSASTAYEIERKLEPSAFGYTKNHEPFHKNKWTKYQVGKPTPNVTLVNEVDKQVPNTKYLLDHVLWLCLQPNIHDRFNTEEWLKKLIPDIQKLVFQHNSTNNIYSSNRIKHSVVQLKMLERRAGIEALACLMILFHEASSERSHDRALDLGISIYKVLLVISNTLPFKKFTSELFLIFNKRVFSQINANGLGFRFDEFNFFDAVELLSDLLLVLEDNGQSINSLNTMNQLIDGKYGFDIMSALRAPIGPISTKSEHNIKDYQIYERQQETRAWARSNIYLKTRKIFPD
jgi:hypothetical protein